MYLGDNLLADGITGLVDEFVRDRPDALILLQHVTDPSSFGIAELDAEGRVDPARREAEGAAVGPALVGVYMFTDAIWESVKAIQPSARGELEITDAIQHLVDRGLTVRPHIVTGWWKDTGRREDMLDANRLVLDTIESRCEGTLGEDVVLEGRVVVEQGAVLERCLIRGPGGDRQTRAHRRRVHRPLHVDLRRRGHRACRDRVLDHPRARAHRRPGRAHRELAGGRDALITRSDQKPRAHRFMVGDSSQIWVL